MKKLTFLISFICLMGAGTSCTLSKDHQITNNVAGKKVGTVKNGTIQEAAQNGGIEKIGTVDMTTKHLFFIIQWTNTTVTGE